MKIAQELENLRPLVIFNPRFTTYVLAALQKMSSMLVPISPGGLGWPWMHAQGLESYFICSKSIKAVEGAQQV